MKRVPSTTTLLHPLCWMYVLVASTIDLFRNLNSKFKICNTCNKVKSKSESFSTIPVSIWNDMEPLYGSDDIFIYHTVGRNLTVEVLFFFGKFLFALAFDGKNGIGMYLLYAKIAGVGFESCWGFGSNAGFLEKSKIVPFAIGKRRANNSFRIPLYNNLRLYRMTLFLTWIPFSLPLLGVQSEFRLRLLRWLRTPHHFWVRTFSQATKMHHP